MTYKDYFIYKVPVMEREGVKRPRTPKGIGYFAIHYEGNSVYIRVTIGGHNYLKKRGYAKLLVILSREQLKEERETFNRLIRKEDGRLRQND